MARGSIVKRGERYAIVYRAPDPVTGQPKQIWKSGFATKREAEKALKAQVASVDDGRHVRPSNMSFGQYMAEEWLPGHLPTLKPTTAAMYRVNAETHIIPALGMVPLQNITAAKLSAFYGELLEGGRCDGRGGLSTRTVRICHGVIRGALRDAVAAGH